MRRKTAHVGRCTISGVRRDQRHFKLKQISEILPGTESHFALGHGFDAYSLPARPQ